MLHLMPLAVIFDNLKPVAFAIADQGGSGASDDTEIELSTFAAEHLDGGMSVFAFSVSCWACGDLIFSHFAALERWGEESAPSMRWRIISQRLVGLKSCMESFAILGVYERHRWASSDLVFVCRHG